MSNQSPSYISGPVTSTVYLGENGYGRVLIIDPTGSVYPAQQGANGVVSEIANGKITNQGQVTGGAGGSASAAGIGIDLQAGGTVINMNAIAGGYGGSSDFNGGTGVDLAAGGVITNGGQISGGYGGYGAYGGIGVDVSGGGTLHNTDSGVITGGTASFYDTGGTGVMLNGGAAENAGAIAGGYGGASDFIYGGYGGNGVAISSGSFENTGSIAGGIGGYSVVYGGYGGTGVVLDGGTLKNAGTIVGGTGGYGDNRGGGGGAGVVLSGGVLTNTGSIEGGAGINSGAGGPGAVLDGGTLRNTGTISGGSLGSQSPGDAVLFGSSAATLMVGTGAVFEGDVVGNGSNDALVLVASQHQGHLAGLGTQITGMTTINETAGATWTLTGGAILQTGETLDVRGTLSIDGMASGGGRVVIENGATLKAEGALSIGAVHFTGAPDLLVLGSPTEVTSILSGFDTGDTIDLAKLVANGESFAHGTLTLLSGSTQVAQLRLAGEYNSSNFTLTSDGHGGTNIGFVASAHTALAADFGVKPGAAEWLPREIAAEPGPWLKLPQHANDWLMPHHQII